MKSKINFYQKITLLIYLITLFLTTMIFVPFRSYKEGIIFSKLWSNYDKLDLYRLSIEILFISIVFVIIYKLTSTLNNPDYNSKGFKNIFKRELLILFSIIIILFGAYLYMYFTNRNIKNQLNILHNSGNALPEMLNDLRAKEFSDLDINLSYIFFAFYIFRLLFYYIKKFVKYLMS